MPAQPQFILALDQGATSSSAGLFGAGRRDSMARWGAVSGGGERIRELTDIWLRNRS